LQPSGWTKPIFPEDWLVTPCIPEAPNIKEARFLTPVKRMVEYHTTTTGATSLQGADKI
jgi:hypothetical protein